MKFNIIAGALRHRVVHVPDTATFRPTLSRVRQALCDSLGVRVRNAVVADVCAGSGMCGFELLSRGAAEVVFCEKSPVLARSIQHHSRMFGVETQCRVVCADVHHFASSVPGRFDIVFYDPPYDDPRLVDCLPLLGMVAPGGIFLFQRDATIRLADDELRSRGFSVNSRTWGRTIVDFLTRTA